MKNALKLLMMIATSSFCLTPIKAQQPRDPEVMQKRKEMAEQRFKEFSEKLSLNADQQAKIKTIINQNRMEMKEIRESKKDAPKEERRAAMAEQLKKGNGQINAVLDPRQQELYKLYKEEKKTERKNKMQERRDQKEQVEDGLF